MEQHFSNLTRFSVFMKMERNFERDALEMSINMNEYIEEEIESQV
jgi:hypothetical protein